MSGPTLSRLRAMGWTLWDPIGLLPSGADWESPECVDFVDEYDGYLRNVVAMLRQGVAEDRIVQRLCEDEAVGMGLGLRPDTQSRAKALVAAIRAAMPPP